LDDATVDTVHAGPHHFRRAGRRRQAERDDPGGEGVDEDADLGQAVVEEEELDDERRVAEDVDIGDRGEAYRRDSRPPGEGETEAGEHAEDDRQDRDDDGDRQPVDKRSETLEHGYEEELHTE